MSQLEYLIALVSIIVGLGLTDLAQSLRELVRPSRTVRWHWLPLTWAAIALTGIVQIWWSCFQFLQEPMFSRAAVFFPVLLAFLLLYLICAFSLPDLEWIRQRQRGTEPSSSRSSAGPSRQGAGEEGAALDLESFYFSASHRRWFFGSFIGLIVLLQVLSAIGLAAGERALQPTQFALNAGVNLGGALLLSGLIVTDHRWVHGTVTLLIAGTVLYTLVAGLPTLG